MGNLLKKIGLNNLVDKLRQAEDQNVNLQIGLAAISTYFGAIPKALQKQLDTVLSDAQKDRKATMKTLLDAVVAATAAFRDAEVREEQPATETEMAPAATLGRQQVLEGKAGEVISVTREVV